jgi:hypothetical protein
VFVLLPYKEEGKHLKQKEDRGDKKIEGSIVRE